MFADFELYCAICGAPLSTENCEIADPDLSDYDLIRAWVVEKRRRDEYYGAEEALKDALAAFTADDGHRRYLWEYKTYDPKLLGEDDLEWLEDFSALGIDPAAAGGPR